MDIDIRTYDASRAPGSGRHAIAPVAPLPERDPDESAAERGVDRRSDAPPDDAAARNFETAVDGYRLSFDSEKGRVYLELVNPATGDVMQRFPRDDLQEAFGATAAGPDGPRERLDVRV